VKELRWLPLDEVTHKLEDPADYEERHRHRPDAVNEDCDDEEWQGNGNHRDAEGVAQPVHRMLVALTVLHEPLLHGFVA